MFRVCVAATTPGHLSVIELTLNFSLLHRSFYCCYMFELDYNRSASAVNELESSSILQQHLMMGLLNYSLSLMVEIILSPTFFTPIILLFQKQHGTNDSCVSCICVQKSKMHKEAAFFNCVNVNGTKPSSLFFKYIRTLLATSHNVSCRKGLILR